MNRSQSQIHHLFNRLRLGHSLRMKIIRSTISISRRGKKKKKRQRMKVWQSQKSNQKRMKKCNAQRKSVIAQQKLTNLSLGLNKQKSQFLTFFKLENMTQCILMKLIMSPQSPKHLNNSKVNSKSKLRKRWIETGHHLRCLYNKLIFIACCPGFNHHQLTALTILIFGINLLCHLSILLQKLFKRSH